MSRVRINPEWAAVMEREVFGGVPVDVTTPHAAVAQWLVMALSNAKREFRVVNLGAGVKRVTTDVKVCPKCNGTGRC